MKDFDETLASDQESAQHAHQKQLKLIGIMPKKKGLTLYECDPKTRVVQEAKYTEEYDINRKAYVKKVVVAPGCLYRQFLNLENAIKKFEKIMKRQRL